MGAPLFHRDGNLLSLTEHSRAFLPIVTDALDRLEAGSAMTCKQDRHIKLTVAARPNVALRWLAPRLTRFYKACPGLQMKLLSSYSSTEAIRDIVDACIVYREGKPEKDYLFLFEADLFPVCCSDLLRTREHWRPSDLLELPLLTTAGGQNEWPTWFAVAGCDASTATGSALSFDTAALAVESAAQGLGVALTSGMFVADDLESGRLVVPCPIRAKKPGAYYIMLPRHADGRAQRLFAQWLMTEAQSTSAALLDLSRFGPHK